MVLDQLLAKLQRKRGSWRAKRRGSFETLAGMTPSELLDAAAQDDAGARRRDWFSTHGRRSCVPRRLYDGERSRSSSRPTTTSCGGWSTATARGRSRRTTSSFRDVRADAHQRDPGAPGRDAAAPRPDAAAAKELKLALDGAGYTEATLQTAWRDMTNQDIAATIIGFIRQPALGTPLYRTKSGWRPRCSDPRQPRVDGPQRKWLERIGKQLDARSSSTARRSTAASSGPGGGFDRLNKVFEGKLEMVLGDVQDEVWKESA